MQTDNINKNVRLREWLINVLNTNEVPGVEWMDKSEKIFKIPWEHKGKQNWSQDHGLLFTKWAQHTGKVASGDCLKDYSKLKSRLRCALNKAEDIVEVRSESFINCSEPFKAYRFIEPRLKKKKTRWTSEVDDTLTNVESFPSYDSESKIPVMVQNLSDDLQMDCEQSNKIMTDGHLSYPFDCWIINDNMEIQTDNSSIACHESRDLFNEAAAYDTTSHDPKISSGHWIEVFLGSASLMKESFCTDEKLLLKPDCYLYGEDDPDLPVDKTVCIPSIGDHSAQKLLQKMNGGLHFHYDGEYLTVQRRTKFSVYYISNTCTAAEKLQNDVTLRFGNEENAFVRFFLAQNPDFNGKLMPGGFVVSISHINDDNP